MTFQNAAAWATVDGPSIQIHLDFEVDEPAATDVRAMAAGVTCRPDRDHCTAFSDPAAHPFRLSTWTAVPS